MLHCKLHDFVTICFKKKPELPSRLGEHIQHWLVSSLAMEQTVAPDVQSSSALPWRSIGPWTKVLEVVRQVASSRICQMV
jgi:hypothetical protein